MSAEGGSLVTNGDGFGAAGSCVAGVTLAASQAPFACSIDVRGSLATNRDGFGAAGSCVAGVALSARSGSICVAGVALAVSP